MSSPGSLAMLAAMRRARGVSWGRTRYPTASRNHGPSFKGAERHLPAIVTPPLQPTKNELVASPQIGGLTAFFPHQVQRDCYVLTALVLICSVGVAPDLAHCTRSNARVVMSVPTEDRNPITCFMHAQAYVAETSFGQELGVDDRVKIVCVRRDTVLAAP
jgi:hypothetical protein